MENLKIGVRLAIAFSALLFLLSGITYLGWSSLAATKAQIDVIAGENNVKIAFSNSMLSRLNAQNRLAKMNEIAHSYSPVRTPEMNGPSGAITPKTGGALAPEIDNC